MASTRNRKLSDRLDANTTCVRNPELSRLIAQASVLGRREEKVLTCLPPELREAVKLAEFTDTKLVLICHSAALATRLRMLQEKILRNLRAQPEWRNLNMLDIKIRPRARIRKAVEKHQTLSKENARILLEEAGHTNDKQLKAVLTRIASKADPQS